MDDTRQPVLDDALRARWADALESGEYPQGHKTLLDAAGRWCCLGVLGNICHVWPKVSGQDEAPTYLTRNGRSMDVAFGEPVTSLIRGLDMEQQRFFARLNDVKHLDFAHIAEAVRAKRDLDPLRGEDRR